MASLSGVVSVASLSFKSLPEVACLMLWSLCKLSVAVGSGSGTWAGVTAQKQNLELPLNLNQGLKEPVQSATSWVGSGNVRLQCQ